MFSERQRKIFKWTGYPIFAFICFLFFMVTTLPYDKMQDKLIGYARDQLKLNVEIEELSGAFPLGVVAKGITLDSDVDREKRGLPIEIGYLKIKAGLLSSLMGWNKMDISAEIFGGEIDGTVAVDASGEQMKIELEINELKLEEINYFKSMFPELPIKGKMSSDIDLEWNSKKLKESKGKLSFKISKGTIGPGKWQVDLPLIRTGDLEAAFSIADGKMLVDSYVHSSPDMQSDMNGDFMLGSTFGLWRPNINYRFKLSEDLVNKNEIFKLGLSMIQNAKGKNDFYYFSLRGSMQMPRWQPNRGLAAAFDKADKSKAEPADKKSERKRPAATRPAIGKPGADGKTARPASKATPRKTPPRRSPLKERQRPERSTAESPERRETPEPPEAPERQNDEAPNPMIEEKQVQEPAEEEEIIEEAVEEEPVEEAAPEEEENQEEEPAEANGDSVTEEDNQAEEENAAEEE